MECLVHKFGGYVPIKGGIVYQDDEVAVHIQKRCTMCGKLYGCQTRIYSFVGVYNDDEEGMGEERCKKFVTYVKGKMVVE
jgi:hypothetical protein